MIRSPIYYCQGRVVGCFDLEVAIDTYYTFTNPTAYLEINQYIADNWYMFECEECDRFYCSNTNMFSLSNEVTNVRGCILRIKKKYGGWV